jgi:hypothetical protein
LVMELYMIGLRSIQLLLQVEKDLELCAFSDQG